MEIGLKNLEKIVRTLVEASVDTGVATGGGADWLDDAAKSWPDNTFAGLIVEITGGTGAGQIRKIVSNTATRLTITPAWTTVPDATSTYRIGFYGKISGDISSWGGVAVTGRDITQDLAKLDIALSALRDGITAASPNNKTLYDLYTRLATDGIMIGNSLIAVPTDKQAIYRTQAFLTTTALGPNASYTSASFDALFYRRITGKVFADQIGTLNLQHSDDGYTWDTLTSISVSANSPAKYDEPIYARYVRVYYVNGTTAQTVFRLSGYLSAD